MRGQQAIFENNDEAAHAIFRYLSELRPSLNRFTLRPFNHYSPEFTEWWFIPSTDWPAYRYSKLCVHKFPRCAEETKWLYTGFYMEQGLDGELAGLPGVKHSLIMQPNWYWYEFLHHAKKGEMDSALVEVLERSQCPVLLTLDVYEFNHVPSPDEECPAPYDWIEYSIHSCETDFQLTRAGNKVLAQLNACTSMKELAQQLETMDLRYFWANLVIGIRLQYGTAMKGSWGAAEIWHNALEPWNPWVR